MDGCRSGQPICDIVDTVTNCPLSSLLLPAAPLSVRVSPGYQRADVGSRARIGCEVRGFPVGRVAWLRDGREVPGGAEAEEQGDRKVISLGGEEILERGRGKLAESGRLVALFFTQIFFPYSNELQ